jgi:hypothetical protein
MKGREDREKDYGFAAELGEAGAAAAEDDIDFDTVFQTRKRWSLSQTASARSHHNALPLQGFTDQQKSQLKDNTEMIATREHEIINIVSSINELSTIFKDLAALVVDQVRGRWSSIFAVADARPGLLALILLIHPNHQNTGHRAGPHRLQPGTRRGTH